MCVFYRLSNATYFIIKFLIKTKFISLVNIILERKVVEEFIQGDASADNITNEIEKINSNLNYRNNLINDISMVEKILLDDTYKISISSLVEKSV